MPVKNREQLLFILVLACVGLLVADRLILTPLITTWNDRSKKITELQTNINSKSLLVDRERKMQDDWLRMVRESRSTSDQVTEKQVLDGLSNWAISSRLTVTSQKLHWITGEEDCRKLEVRVSATGSLGAIARFIYALESDPQALKVEEMALSAKDDKGQTINCDVRFTRLVLEDGKKL
jgi:Tfp pilus assembly protein PilO